MNRIFFLLLTGCVHAGAGLESTLDPEPWGVIELEFGEYDDQYSLAAGFHSRFGASGGEAGLVGTACRSSGTYVQADLCARLQPAHLGVYEGSFSLAVTPALGARIWFPYDEWMPRGVQGAAVNAFVVSTWLGATWRPLSDEAYLTLSATLGWGNRLAGQRR